MRTLRKILIFLALSHELSRRESKVSGCQPWLSAKPEPPYQSHEKSKFSLVNHHQQLSTPQLTLHGTETSLSHWKIQEKKKKKHFAIVLSHCFN